MEEIFENKLVFQSVSNHWSNLRRLKCEWVLKQMYLFLSVCQDLSDASWLSVQENYIYAANDEVSHLRVAENRQLL